jgi:hypothetical protein
MTHHHRAAGWFLAAITGFASTTLPAQQGGRPVADSVTTLIDHIAASEGSFSGSYAIGSFTGDRSPFDALFHLAEQSPDPVLSALTTCFTNQGPTRVRYMERRLSRGGLCYFALHNLAYRETEPEEHWPGNVFGFPTPAQLHAAQEAWREAIRKHWYSLS